MLYVKSFKMSKFKAGDIIYNDGGSSPHTWEKLRIIRHCRNYSRHAENGYDVEILDSNWLGRKFCIFSDWFISNKSLYWSVKELKEEFQDE